MKYKNILFVITGYKALKGLENSILNLSKINKKLYFVFSEDPDENYTHVVKKMSNFTTLIKFPNLEKNFITKISRRIRWFLLISNFLRPGHPTKFDTIYVHQLRAKGYPFLNQLFNSKILRFFFAKKIFRNFLRILEKFIPTHK